MFQRLKDHQCGLSNSMGCPLQITIAVSQSADSGNGLAAIDPIAGIGLPLQLKQISSGMPISAISHSGKPIAATNHRTGFQREMRQIYQP